MISIGLDVDAKRHVIHKYLQDHTIRHVILFSPQRFRFERDPSDEHVEWDEVIQYKFYYPLIQKIDGSTLLVINECLRTQNRHDLTYNCFRNFLNQTTHQIIFQRFPIIDTWEDFSILFDFDTRSRWKREAVTPEHARKEASVYVDLEMPTLQVIDVEAGSEVHQKYAKEKAKLLADVRGNIDRDPHILPRNLLLVSGPSKKSYLHPGVSYVARNSRLASFGIKVCTFREVTEPGNYTVVEPPHNFIDFSDFLAVSKQRSIDMLVADTKADQWYLKRTQDWLGRVRDASAILRG